MKRSKRFFFSFSLLCLFVLSSSLVGSVSAATYGQASGIIGYGNTVSGGTTYDYTGDAVGVFFLDSSYVGNTIDINSQSSYTIYANYTVNGSPFEGTYDVWWGEPTNVIAFSGMQLRASETTALWYSGYDADVAGYVMVNLPSESYTSEIQYLGIDVHCYNYAEGVDFHVYYMLVIDPFAGSPFATPTSFPLPTEGGWSGVDWVDGFDVATAPMIVQLLLVFILMLGLPMCLVVMVPKAGMIGFSGLMLVASVVCYAFLGFPVYILIFTAVGAALMLFSLMYRG